MDRNRKREIIYIFRMKYESLFKAQGRNMGKMKFIL